MVQTPVLFMTFVRPECARKSWEAIKAAQPKTLYFYSNKGRKEKEGEIQRNNEIRSYVNEIDWDCDLHTWFREECVDIYTSLFGAKNWAFEHEDTLIMLEEDTCASLAFFEFCDHFLEVYKHDKRINFITGNNYADGYDVGDRDHIICHSIHHLGWATWKDRWEQVDWNIKPQSMTRGFHFFRYFHDFWLSAYYKLLYIELTSFIERTGCWDYIKVLNQVKTKGLAVVPVYNLVKNVGVDGTHTKNGSGPTFEFSNNDERGKYPFTSSPQRISADIKFDIAESTSEGIRDIPQIKRRILQRYWFTDIQDLRNKLRIGTRMRNLIDFVKINMQKTDDER